MKRAYLFPSWCQALGWICLLPSAFLGLCYLYDFLPAFKGQAELSMAGVTLGLLLVAFSRCRQEDECVAALRLSSLTLAVWVAYVVLIGGTLSFYEFGYLEFVIYNQFTVLVVFILAFRLRLWLWRQGRLTVHGAGWLLPSSCRMAGWILFVPFAAGCLFVLLTAYGFAWLDEVCVVGLTLGLLFIVFARERQEDEYIASLRTKAWVWAVYVSYVLLVIGTLLLYDEEYLYFVLGDAFVLPLVFIGKYRWMLYQSRRENHDQ